MLTDLVILVVIVLTLALVALSIVDHVARKRLDWLREWDLPNAATIHLINYITHPTCWWRAFASRETLMVELFTRYPGSIPWCDDCGLPHSGPTQSEARLVALNYARNLPPNAYEVDYAYRRCLRGHYGIPRNRRTYATAHRRTWAHRIAKNVNVKDV